MDVASGRVRRHLDLGLAPAVADPQVSPLFGPRDRELVIADVSSDGPGGPPTQLRRYDLGRGAWVGGWRRFGGHTARVARSPNRRWLVVSDERAREAYVLDTATLAVRHIARGDFVPAIDSTGERIAEGSLGGTVRLVDARTGTVRLFAGRHDGAVNRMAFTADGRTLVTAGLDGVAFVWDVAGGEVRDKLAGHRGLITDISLSPDGRTAFTSSLDGTSIAWDLAGDRRFGRPFADSPLARARRRRWRSPRTVRGWSSASGTARSACGMSAGCSAPARSGDCRRLRPRSRSAPTGAGWPPSPKARVAILAPCTCSMQAAGSRTGRRCAGSLRAARRRWPGRPTAASWRRVTMRATCSPGTRAPARRARCTSAARVSPCCRSRSAPTGAGWPRRSTPGGAEVHDVAGGRLVAALRSARDARWVAWSPDGRLLVTGHYDGRARLWATATWRAAGTLAGHEGYVLWAGFSPDGRTLATSGTDGTAVLWDVASRHQIGSALTVDANQWTAASFTPDGRRLLALAVTGRGVVWPATQADWERHACAVAGRSLTRREWADAVPDQPYRPVCG